MIEWYGNLNDDCKADWNGLHLHAEEMDRNYWWWAVFDSNGEIISSSNDSDTTFVSGKKARRAAEDVAKRYLKNRGE